LEIHAQGATEMTQASRILQLVATFLPIYGVIVTIVAALILKRGKRVCALVTIPLVTLWLCSVFGAQIAHDGNMLYVLLAMMYLVGLFIYYPVLLIIGVVWLIRSKKRLIAEETQP
jgi:sugar phosphate permease